MSTVWKTKWGSRRVRHDPPTLAEAIAAAQGFTDDVDAQAAIAADLMGVPVEDARFELRRLGSDRRVTATVVAPSRERGAMRTVVVERRASRRLVSASGEGRAGRLQPR